VGRWGAGAGLACGASPCGWSCRHWWCCWQRDSGRNALDLCSCLPELVVQGGHLVLVCGCRQFHVFLKVGQLLIPGCVSVRQEGQDVVYPSQLSGLTYLSLVGLIGALDDCLPDISGEGFVCVCCVRQLAVYPFFHYFLVSVDTVIYVPSTFPQGLIGLFDFPRPSVSFVIGVAAQPSKLL